MKRCHGSVRRAGSTLAKKQPGYLRTCYPTNGSEPFEVRAQTIAHCVELGGLSDAVVALNFEHGDCMIRDCRRGNARVKSRIVTFPVSEKRWRNTRPALEREIQKLSGFMPLKWVKVRSEVGLTTWECFFTCMSDIALQVAKYVESHFPDVREVYVPINH